MTDAPASPAEQAKSGLPPVDPNIRVPDAAKRASAAAEAAFAAAYKAPEPPADNQPQNTPQPPASAQSNPPPQNTPAGGNEPEEGSADWQHRYNSMRGRYAQQQQVNGMLQEQVSMLGDEVTRLTAVLNRKTIEAPPPPPREAPKLLTQQDVDAFGAELIDFSKRAAQEAILPILEREREERRQLEQRLRTTQQKSIYDTLDQALPNWRQVNNHPKFHQWLRLRDIYSGHGRKALLDQAFKAADAPRVLAFFRGFLAEEQATRPAPQDQPAGGAAPRQTAMDLSTLAAPGRARPASGTETRETSVSKPSFTRAQIAKFYDDVRKGAYRGRETEKSQYEREIFEAQAQGRVR